ncbi:MAG: biopolymer transporter ExbD [Polaromonas sp.]|nr:biopolymer transporter ExbD [Polaromonas sp.]
MPAISSRGRGRRTISEINMVPFIDVMLVLLIIFMVTAPLITPSMIALPKIGRADKQADKPIFVEIQKDERIQIRLKAGSVPSSIGDLAREIIKREPAVTADKANAVPVVISADKSLKYETVVQVMDALQKAGVTRVGLSVQTGK